MKLTQKHFIISYIGLALVAFGLGVYTMIGGFNRHPKTNSIFTLVDEENEKWDISEYGPDWGISYELLKFKQTVDGQSVFGLCPLFTGGLYLPIESDAVCVNGLIEQLKTFENPLEIFISEGFVKQHFDSKSYLYCEITTDDIKRIIRAFEGSNIEELDHVKLFVYGKSLTLKK